jgi:hypothetical protein
MAASLVNWYVRSLVSRGNQLVAEEIAFYLLARNVGEHDAIHLNTGGHPLARFLHHFLVIGTIADNVNVFIGKTILLHHGANAARPATSRF